MPLLGPREEETPEAYFERIFRATYQKTLAYALRRADGEADAHDVVAETYLVAWRRIDQLRRAEEPQAWLYGVAYKTLGNRRRSRRRRQSLAEKVATEPTSLSAPDPAQNAVADDELSRVAEAMERLSPRDREVLRLTTFEGLSHREIGQVLGIKRPLVRSVLYRARQRLTRAVEDQPSSRQSSGAGHSKTMDTDESQTSGADDE